MWRPFILFFTSILMAISLWAQGDFSTYPGEEKLISINHVGEEDYSTKITVPEGKVWKVTSAGMGNVHKFWNGVIMVDEKVLSVTSEDHYIDFLPLWLPSGSYNLTVHVNSNISEEVYKGFVSVIEYEKKKLRGEAEKTNYSVSGILMYSKVSPAEGVEIGLYNEKGDEIKTTTTGNKGKFVFKNQYPGKRYSIKVTDDTKLSEKALIYFTNQKGEKVVKVPWGGDEFVYKALPPDKMNSIKEISEEDESLLNISFFGKVYKELPGDYSNKIKVIIENDEGEIIYSTYTDKNGRFKFENLPPDKSYSIKIESEDDDLKLMVSEEGEEAGKKLIRDRFGKFVYERLRPDEAYITLINENDEELVIRENETFTISNIYYDYDEWKVNEQAKTQLDKLALILKKNNNINAVLTSHTDSRASKEYNLELSEKRAKATIDYLVKKGIKRKRLKGEGKGEEEILNHCKDGVECEEDEHAENRRTEIKIISK